jgi:hypothetical protein
MDKQSDIALEILDKKLESIEYSIEIEIEINDTDLKRLQYLAKSFDDPLYDSAKKIQNAT